MAASKDYEQLIYCPRTHDIGVFTEQAEAAKDAGFTHIYISGLTGRTDYQGDDADSPWCEWSISHPAVFKHATPEGLEDAFPAKWVGRQMDFMKEKHEIVAELGLKAAYFGLEPTWLSQRVYDKHPEWRGSRCDNSLRTTGMFFAADTDHPEVRRKYAEGMKTIVEACPLIDTFCFITNDSGAGYPWAGRLYVNPNGPTGTLGKDMGLRVAEFLKVLRQGAADGGADATIITACDGWFTPDECHLIKRSLEPGIGVMGRAPEDLEAECSLMGAGGWGGSIWMEPLIDGYPQPMSIVSAVANIKNSGVSRFEAGGNSLDYFAAFKAAMSMPPANTSRQKLEILEKMAAALYADDVVDEVVDAWYIMEQASIREATAGVSLLTGIMLRWLVRPMVPHQEMLTEEERSYWEPYIYQSQASQPESYLDYLNVTGKPVAATWDEAAHTCIAIDGIEGALKGAVRKLEAARDGTSSDEAREKLQRDICRVRTHISMALTVRHFLQMGTLIYERDRDLAKAEKLGLVDPAVPDLSQGSMGSHGLFFMFRAMRWELDNTNELIRIIEECPVPLVYCDPDKSCEGALVMGPGLLEGLRKKVRIMTKYWRTAEKGYYLPTKGG